MAALPVLRAGLKHRDGQVRWLAVRALAALGPEAKPAADDLKPLLHNEDAGVRRTTAEALWKIRP